MENCKYKQVNTNNHVEYEKSYVSNTWKPFFRQLLISSGVWTSYFMYGLCIGSPTVVIPQIRREANSTEAVSDEMASWLNSIVSFSGFPWVIVLSILVKCIGKKISFLIASVDICAAFILFYCSSSVTHILISGFMQGLFSAAQIVISILILTEYVSPKYRGLFLTIKSATSFWGVWASNAIGTFFHWKNIGLFGILCSLYVIVTTFLWPESPYWLASKGRFEECAASHRWLKGYDEESEKELKNLIDSQTEFNNLSCTNTQNTLKHKIMDVYFTLRSREFYKPTLIAFLTASLGFMSGKLVCTVYAVDLLKKITGNEATAYTGMLILDGVTVLSMYFGCVLAKMVRRRILLLVSGSIGIFMLFLLSCYLYLIKFMVITENKYVSIGLLAIYSLTIGCGPLVMSNSIYGELVPVRSRNLAMCVFAIAAKIILGCMLKTAPYIFKALGIHGTFLCFGISSSVCLFLIYIYFPETKDKTLQEIADAMMGKKEVVKLLPSQTIG